MTWNNDPGQQLDGGPDVLNAHVYGDDIPGLKMAALDKARALYGPTAELRIEETGEIDTVRDPEMHDGRQFRTHVRVRCLNLPAEDR